MFPPRAHAQRNTASVLSVPQAAFPLRTQTVIGLRKRLSIKNSSTKAQLLLSKQPRYTGSLRALPFSRPFLQHGAGMETGFAVSVEAMEDRPWQLLVVERLDCRCELACGGSRFSYPQWGFACSSFYPHSHPQISASSTLLCTSMTLKTAEEASLFPNACPLRHLFKPLAPITEVAQLRAHTHCEHLSPLGSFSGTSFSLHSFSTHRGRLASEP